MARLVFPSGLELKRREGSFNEAPLENVIFTRFLYVSPVQTRPPWDQTGVPGDVAFFHFHSSTIAGSASWMISRTLASVFPRQSPSSLIFWLIDAEADFAGTGLFMPQVPMSSRGPACVPRSQAMIAGRSDRKITVATT